MVRPAPAVAWTIAAALAALAACDGRTLVAYPDKLAGVGIVLNREAQGFVITRVVPGGPADEAGVREGDRLLAVEGQPAEGRTLAGLVAALRGEPGTDVLVKVAGARGEVSVVLRRRALEKSGGGYEAR